MTIIRKSILKEITEELLNIGQKVSLDSPEHVIKSLNPLLKKESSFISLVEFEGLKIGFFTTYKNSPNPDEFIQSELMSTKSVIVELVNEFDCGNEVFELIKSLVLINRSKAQICDHLFYKFYTNGEALYFLYSFILIDWVQYSLFLKNRKTRETANSQQSESDKMGYLEIILKGFSDQNSRQFFKSYLNREQKKAEQKHYPKEEFFHGCELAIEILEQDINRQFYALQREYSLNLSRAKSGQLKFNDSDQDLGKEEKEKGSINYFQNQLTQLTKAQFSVNLFGLTNGRYVGQLRLADIKSLKNELSQVNKIHDLPNEDLPTISEAEKHKRSLMKVGYVDEEMIKRMPHLNLTISQKYEFLPPPVSNNDGLERLHKIYGQFQFESLIKAFKEKFGQSPSIKAITDELKELDEFIEKAKKIKLNEAFDFPTRDKTGYEYLRLTNGFYERNLCDQSSGSCTSIVYGKYILFHKWLQKNSPTSQNPSDNPELELKDLFVNEELLNPCIAILRELDPPFINSNFRIIGKPKGIICVWMDELDSQSFLKAVNNKDETFARAINKYFTPFTIDPSMFRKANTRSVEHRMDIKTLLSQVSQDGKNGN